MTDNARSVDSKLRKWLLDTGYPLEMRVAQAFSKFDESLYSDRQVNTHYVDPETNQLREVDLIVSWVKRYGEAIFLVTLVVECKSTKDPWVVFKAHDAPPVEGALFDPSYRHLQKDTPDFEERAFFARLNLEGLLVDNLPSGMTVPCDGYSVVTAFKDRNARDAADSAVRQVLAATRNAGVPVDPEFASSTWYCYSVPVIVTTSPLYEAYLSDDGTTVDLRPVNVSSVSQPLVENIGLDRIAVTIFNESALPELLAHCKHLDEMFNDLGVSNDAIAPEEEGDRDDMNDHWEVSEENLAEQEAAIRRDADED